MRARAKSRVAPLQSSRASTDETIALSTIRSDVVDIQRVLDGRRATDAGQDKQVGRAVQEGVGVRSRNRLARLRMPAYACASSLPLCSPFPTL